jgi:hypothetical protein
MKTFITVFTLVSALLATSLVQAQGPTAHPPADPLEIILQTNRILTDEVRIVKTVKELRNLPESLRAQLTEKAVEMAMIWADTILEGDYWAAEEVRLETVEEVGTTSGRFLGYRITYSAQAWDTSTCDFNPDQMETLKDCQMGRIVETGFVSADFKQSIQDVPAEFIK